MNLYLRFFDDEFLAHNVDEAIDFLKHMDIGDFDLGDSFRADLEAFLASGSSYPKRYKVKARVYFTIIKTDKDTLADFKKGNRSKECSVANKSLYEESGDSLAHRRARLSKFYDVMPGWYDMTITFKRVIPIPGTNKSQYKDETIRVCCTAKSGIDCYNRVVDYLRRRKDIDRRSQYPSVKGHNVEFTYLGSKRPANIG